jgi:glycosyltransferase involved in cell wall biosynthesis
MTTAKRPSGETLPAGESVDISDSGSENGSILAIIPAYNEEDTVADVVAGTQPHVDDVLVIDDGSEDDTERVAREHADAVASHPVNLGVGAAVHTGYRFGIRGGYDVLVQVDGDGQHDPAYIPALLEQLDEETGMVIASRWLNASHSDYSWVRRSGIRFFTLVANVFGGLSVTDVTSGFRAYDVSLLEALGDPEQNHWALGQTLETGRKGYAIEEISVPIPPESEGSQFDMGTYTRYPGRMVLTTLKVCLFR